MPSNGKQKKPKKQAKPLFCGFLYGDDEEETKAAEKILSENGVRFNKFSLRGNPQPCMTAPTFISYEGTFKGLKAIEAYLGWFVNDPAYHQYVTR